MMSSEFSNCEQRLNLTDYDGFIFDLDGTLVDSYLAILEVFKPWCKKHQLDLDHVINLCRGGRLLDFLPEIAPHLNAKQEFEILLEEESKVTKGLIEIDGAKAFLDALTVNGITWGIATSCAHSVAYTRLSHTGFTIPNVFVTSERIKQGKPHPEHFATAAADLGLSPKRCLAFEDSNNGVRSALAAGCDVVVIGEHCTIEHSNIKARIKSYSELSEQLKEITEKDACYA